MTQDTKVCPFCAETIKAAAKKCRFCGEWLEGYTRETALDDQVGGDKISSGNLSDVKGAVIGRESQAASTGDVSGTFIQADGSVSLGKERRDEQYEIALNWKARGKPRMRSFDLSKRDLSGVNLAKADMRLAMLAEDNLSGADLSGADLSGADLSKANLIGANLRRAVLRYANLNGAVLHGADIRDADLHGTTLFEAYYDQETDFSDLDWLEHYVMLIEELPTVADRLTDAGLPEVLGARPKPKDNENPPTSSKLETDPRLQLSDINKVMAWLDQMLEHPTFRGVVNHNEALSTVDSDEEE